MKPLVSVLASIVLFSLACAAPAVECDDDEVEIDGECEPSDDLFGDADTDADTDSDTDADFDVELEWVPMSGDVRWNVAASGETTNVALYLVDTGDPTFEGCDLEAEGGLGSLGTLWCNIWTEAHDNFAVVDGTNDLGGTTQFIRLAETEYPDQQNNESTLFTAEYLDIGQTTWLAVVEGPGGSGCSAGGDDPAFFDSVCP